MRDALTLFILTCLLFMMPSYPGFAAVAPPTSLAIVSCKTEIAGPDDQNSFYTHSENRRWVIKDAMMICRREEATLQDVAEANGATPLNHNFADKTQCARAGAMLAPAYNGKHGDWYFLMVGCPTVIVNRYTNDKGIVIEEIIGYQLPPCPHWVRCETDTPI